MNDHDLRDLLKETWPVRPGQESRAWSAWQTRSTQGSARPAAAWRALLVSSGAAIACAALFLALWPTPPVAPVSAASQSPEIFATAFYSKPAQAQVVWLNGMAPATDGPTYMDPSSRIDPASGSAQTPAANDQL